MSKQYPNYSKLAPIKLFEDVSRDQDLALDIANNMRTYGGSFVKALAECLVLADQTNRYKLAEAFSEYFYNYLPSKWEKGGEKDDKKGK